VLCNLSGNSFFLAFLVTFFQSFIILENVYPMMSELGAFVAEFGALCCDAPSRMNDPNVDLLLCSYHLLRDHARSRTFSKKYALDRESNVCYLLVAYEQLTATGCWARMQHYSN
jgi:hypothetical protein